MVRGSNLCKMWKENSWGWLVTLHIYQPMIYLDFNLRLVGMNQSWRLMEARKALSIFSIFVKGYLQSWSLGVSLFLRYDIFQDIFPKSGILSVNIWLDKFNMFLLFGNFFPCRTALLSNWIGTFFFLKKTCSYGSISSYETKKTASAPIMIHDCPNPASLLSLWLISCTATCTLFLFVLVLSKSYIVIVAPKKCNT